MSEKDEQPRQRKNTNEKPVSLHPIPFDEVLRDLLSVKPPPKEQDSKQYKRKKK